MFASIKKFATKAVEAVKAFASKFFGFARKVAREATKVAYMTTGWVLINARKLIPTNSIVADMVLVAILFLTAWFALRALWTGIFAVGLVGLLAGGPALILLPISLVAGYVAYYVGMGTFTAMIYWYSGRKAYAHSVAA